MDMRFIINSILLGAGLAMDAFSVSCANALREPKMRLPRMSLIAGVFGFFQFLMPMAGWLCVHTIEEHFAAVQGYIPWIALVLLVWIGGNMILEAVRERRESAEASEPVRERRESAEASETVRERRESAEASEPVREAGRMSASLLLIQAVATSIDALSVGFTIAGYRLQEALASCLIIGAVTFLICMGGLEIGKRAGTRLTWKAGIFGGTILIAIGLEIVISGYL